MTEKKTRGKTDKALKKLQAEYDELKEVLQRLQAEFQNYRKRTDDEKSKFVTMANKDLIKKIIPIIDHLELALKSSNENNDFYKGVEMIYTQLKDVLHEEGLSEIPSSGKFNPQLHEALLTERSELEDGTILEELQKGYKLGDSIIRHSKVKIAKGGNAK